MLPNKSNMWVNKNIENFLQYRVFSNYLPYPNGPLLYYVNEYIYRHIGICSCDSAHHLVRPTFTDLNGLDRWIKGHFLIFNIKALNLWARGCRHWTDLKLHFWDGQPWIFPPAPCHIICGAPGGPQQLVCTVSCAHRLRRNIFHTHTHI